MFSRQVLAGRQIVSTFAKQKAVSQCIKRFNSSKTNSTPPPKYSKGKLLAVLGTLAIGSTIAASFYNKETPKSAFEPNESGDKPEFAEGKVSVIFVLGGPGSGKGTQSDKLVKEKGFVHLSAGDLLRAEQNRPGSKYGELIAKYIKEGEIVPQEVTVALLKQAIKENYEQGKTKFLVDGFPRKMDQALTFENTIAKSAFTLFFECPEQVMLERLLERGKTSGRADDNIESIKKRFRTFIDTSMPVVDYFDKQGKVIKVRCDQPIDVVANQVKDALKTRGI
ncbi:UMP-CMP kinase [Candida albicans Ca6]|nr:UMP-CMP kinase [Candida albicans Ca6]